MKTKYALIVIVGMLEILMVYFPAFAQSPQGLNYQAVARDPSGSVLANKAIDIKIGINNFATSELDYEELHVLETDEFGLFSLIIGNGESLKGDFTQIDWGSKSYGIAVKIDIGSGMEDLGVNILQSVPYAFYADKAGSIDNVFLRDLEDVDLSGLQEGYVLTWNGTTWSANEVAMEDLVIAHEAIKVSAGAGLNGGGTFTGEEPIEITLDAAIDEPLWNASKLQGKGVATINPGKGDVLKWDGVQWSPQSDEIGSGGGAGDISAVAAGEGLKGGGTAGEVTLEADFDAPIWHAGKIGKQQIAENMAPKTGEVIKYDGSKWISAPDEKGVAGGAGDIEAVNAGVGLSGGGTAGEVTLSAKNDDPIWNATKLQSRNVGNQVPNRGDVLKWDGSQWKPDVDNAGATGSGDIEAIIAGTGLSGGGTAGEVTLNAQNNEPLWNAAKLQGSNISGKKPDVGQVLKWSGSQWEVNTDNAGPWSLVGNTVYYQKGNVGINTAKMIGNSNLTMLSDKSSGYGGMQVAMESSVPRPDVKPFYGYAVNGSPKSWTYYDNLSTEWRLYNGGDSRLVVRGTNGHVGIGTTNPLFDLHVNGSAGKPGGGSWSNASDKRLKTNVKDFSFGLDIINEVRPVNFQYNGKLGLPTLKNYVGVIAQELQKIAPFMVSEFMGEDGTTYLNVDPSAFDFILINAVKEQQKLIEALKTQVARQQVQIYSLEKLAEDTQQLEHKISVIENLLLIRSTEGVNANSVSTK